MILPVRKILCPIDFSGPSYEGLKAAKELAKHFSAKLLLVHVVALVPIIPASEGTMGAQIPILSREMQDSANKALQEAAAEMAAEGIQTEIFVPEGAAAHEIVRLAKEENADVIVIATHGQSGWRKFLSGSVTERVVRISECPVLTIHAPKHAA